ncbi:hypothetical protein FJM67_12595 [Maribrevibacterium harenarium]|uniref:Uncharacterized protein n=1 Tax=Maribrevibacterium harenarium TaxID=2589817 RepID=A0A501WKS0_9GAMM|nr:hypothetical protein [Maribrevibacterium harenarium]TPE49025.1 hypothetical protein FJM67_12595 [Maribrevibacterium harenarium]
MVFRGDYTGTGLDVFTNESNVPSALLELDNAALQPICANGIFETRAAMARVVMDISLLF